MIKGAESVRAINPSFAPVTSGASAAATGLGLADSVVAAGSVPESELQPLIKNVAAVVAPAVIKNLRLDKFDMVEILQFLK